MLIYISKVAIKLYIIVNFIRKLKLWITTFKIKIVSFKFQNNNCNVRLQIFIVKLQIRMKCRNFKNCKIHFIHFSEQI